MFRHLLEGLQYKDLEGIMKSTVHIDEFARENWAVGGILHSDRHRGRHDEAGR